MTASVTVLPVEASDLDAISALHASVFGPGRFTRASYRVREGLPPISRFCLKAELSGVLVAAIRFSEITIGGRGGALLLGPLAVVPVHAGLGYGKRLIADGMGLAREAGVELVVLVGNEPYYGRLGFKVVPGGRIVLPGPVDPARLLAAELTAGALGRFQGPVAGARDPTAAFGPLTAPAGALQVGA